MDISIRLGSGLAQLSGNPRMIVSLPEGATVGDLIEHLRSQSPELTPRLNSILPVIAGRHVDITEPLAHQSEVALLLPVSGGSNEDAMDI